MNKIDFKPDDTPSEQLLKIRQRLIERIWQGLVVVAIVAAPASAARAVFTGWKYLYSFHIALAALIVAVFWFRTKISYAAKSILLIGIFWSVGLGAIFNFGIIGAGYWWLVLSSLLAMTLYSVRAGIITAVIVTLFVVAAGIGFISGAFKVTVDANVYLTSVTTWLTLLVAVVVTPFIVFQAVAAYQQTTQDLLKEVHEQRDRIRQLATHDQLTGLPLPQLAADRLQIALHAARRSRKKVALLFIDLDGFKNVNDTLGHEAGDHALQEVAARLLKTIRAEDTAARVGGDEFIAILGGLPDDEVAARIATRAINAISEPIAYGDGSISLGASIGIGLFPDHADDEQTLRRAADAAMYRVKRSGKNRFAFADQRYRENADAGFPEAIAAKAKDRRG